jgi:uncharacterized protein YbaR (Trm112 family)
VLNADDLLTLLACPKCHAKLAAAAEPAGFVCHACKLFFALEDGLPNMLISEARAWPLASAPVSA